jgi:catechol 2,3-dioxygenase-like lactoylglutathione lyase family enzyme
MLADRPAVATVAVKDLAAAKRFYADVLGLTQIASQGEETVTYAAGSGKLLVYRSQFSGTNKATAVTWLVGNDLERIAETLKSKGLAFEHYDLPQLKRQGDIHEGGGTRVAWFKDPDGNIHSIANG